MEYIEMKNSPGFKLQIHSICSVGILSILEVIAKISKYSTPEKDANSGPGGAGFRLGGAGRGARGPAAPQ